MIVDELGNVVQEKKMSNDSIVEFVASHHPARVAMEASPSITIIYRKLVREGYDVLVSHPAKTRLIAESRIRNDCTFTLTSRLEWRAPSRVSFERQPVDP